MDKQNGVQNLAKKLTALQQQLDAERHKSSGAAEEFDRIADTLDGNADRAVQTALKFLEDAEDFAAPNPSASFDGTLLFYGFCHFYFGFLSLLFWLFSHFILVSFYRDEHTGQRLG